MSDEGELKCTATNRAGHIVSRANLTVDGNYYIPHNFVSNLFIYNFTLVKNCVSTDNKAFLILISAPPRVKIPKTYEDGIILEIGEVIRLKASISGRPNPIVHWLHNGEEVMCTHFLLV